MKKNKQHVVKKKAYPARDEVQAYLEKFYDDHQKEWQAEIMESQPKWPYLLGLHLRLVELENLETAVKELL